MGQRKYIFLNIQYLGQSFTSMTKTILFFGYIHKFIQQNFLDSKIKNVFSWNNLGIKIMEFQNKFYLYNQNSPYGKRTTRTI
ncbi:hypothetical protein SAMN05443549_1011009 [Flavobacterium fluvii]|uniref:Uncharacterized protein n=1 Tax=Flavobacterium fluvii TaxID=468056 RepID=A0A1M5FYL4_9FLAO|nr:hypothetical protein SAMN05443549_1011009 [Flavobacterium fluvii]